MSGHQDGIRIRKPVYELTLDDLERSAVWEFCLDEEGEEDQDEATVRPRPDLDVFSRTESDVGLAVVKTEFVARSGNRFWGFCTPEIGFNLSCMQPTIITGKGHISFHFGFAGVSQEELEQSYKLLVHDKGTLFPIRFKAVIPTPGWVSEGEITAFQYLNEKNKVIKVE